MDWKDWLRIICHLMFSLGRRSLRPVDKTERKTCILGNRKLRVVGVYSNRSFFFALCFWSHMWACSTIRYTGVELSSLWDNFQSFRPSAECASLPIWKAVSFAVRPHSSMDMLTSFSKKDVNRCLELFKLRTHLVNGTIKPSAWLQCAMLVIKTLCSILLRVISVIISLRCWTCWYNASFRSTDAPECSIFNKPIQTFS